jgi:hypothetical protein
MHHLLTGRDPASAQPLWQYPPVRVLNPRVSAATQRIVARALQNDPAKRYQGAAEMKRDVDRVLNPPGALNTVRGRAIAVFVVLLLLFVGVSAAYEYAPLQRLSAPPRRQPPTATPAATVAAPRVVVPPPSSPTATPSATGAPSDTPIPTATPEPPTATPAPSATAPVVPTSAPTVTAPPQPATGGEIRSAQVPPAISTTFTTDDNMVIDGDVVYPDISVARDLAGALPIHENDIGRVAYTSHGSRSPEDPRIIHLITTVDVPDTTEVVEAVLDRVLMLQIDEKLPIHVIPIRPRERALEMLHAEQQTRPTAVRSPSPQP